MMNVSNKLYARQAFCANSNNTSAKKQASAPTDFNPISKGGEKAVLFKGVVLAGLGFGARALFYLFEDTSAIETTIDWGAKVARKNAKGVKGGKLALLHVGATVAIICGFIAICAAAYTMYKTPEIIYKSKINAHVKGKDMDLYVKGNQLEKELYNQMNDKAKVASDQEKKILAKQYFKLKAAKNEVPQTVQQTK